MTSSPAGSLLGWQTAQALRCPQQPQQQWLQPAAPTSKQPAARASKHTELQPGHIRCNIFIIIYIDIRDCSAVLERTLEHFLERWHLWLENCQNLKHSVN